MSTPGQFLASAEAGGIVCDVGGFNLASQLRVGSELKARFQASSEGKGASKSGREFARKPFSEASEAAVQAELPGNEIVDRCIEMPISASLRLPIRLAAFDAAVFRSRPISSTFRINLAMTGHDHADAGFKGTGCCCTAPRGWQASQRASHARLRDRDLHSLRG